MEILDQSVFTYLFICLLMCNLCNNQHSTFICLNIINISKEPSLQYQKDCAEVFSLIVQKSRGQSSHKSMLENVCFVCAALKTVYWKTQNFLSGIEMECIYYYSTFLSLCIWEDNSNMQILMSNVMGADLV